MIYCAGHFIDLWIICLVILQWNSKFYEIRIIFNRPSQCIRYWYYLINYLPVIRVSKMNIAVFGGSDTPRCV
mgnify:FL=1